MAKPLFSRKKAKKTRCDKATLGRRGACGVKIRSFPDANAVTPYPARKLCPASPKLPFQNHNARISLAQRSRFLRQSLDHPLRGIAPLVRKSFIRYSTPAMSVTFSAGPIWAMRPILPADLLAQHPPNIPINSQLQILVAELVIVGRLRTHLD